MKHTFVAFAGCTRLVRVNTRYKDKLIFDFFLNFCKTADVITNSFFVVGGARTDNDHKFV